MEITLLFLLLPLAAFSGWWIGSRRSKTRSDSTLPGFSSHYFKGLNFLLNEQPDKAIDVFVKMLKVDSDTVETHLALGNLFRRRGEGERAIRIHQNLIARPTLSKSQRALALYELGQDYLKAGLLGRAESLFLELLTKGDYHTQALERLLDIYQQEKDWQKAIDISRRIGKTSEQDMSVMAAQFYCELGDTAVGVGDTKGAIKMASRALGCDRQCVRASLLRADVEKTHGNTRAAIKILKQVENQNPYFLPEVVGRLLECFQHLNKLDEAERYFTYLLDQHGGITPLLAIAELIKRRKGEKAASECIVSFLSKRPSVRGLDRLIELNLVHSDGVARDNLFILKELTNRLLEEKSPYRCRQCGFKAKTLIWHCPGCKQWASIQPIQGVVGE